MNSMHFQKKYFDFLVKMFLYLKNHFVGFLVWIFGWLFLGGSFIANPASKTTRQYIKAGRGHEGRWWPLGLWSSTLG